MRRIFLFIQIQPITLIQKITYDEVSHDYHDSCHDRIIIAHKGVVPSMKSHTYEKCDDISSSIFFATSHDDVGYYSCEDHMHDHGGEISGDC